MVCTIKKKGTEVRAGKVNPTNWINRCVLKMLMKSKIVFLNTFHIRKRHISINEASSTFTAVTSLNGRILNAKQKIPSIAHNS
jgi:hypothetical protein